MIKKYFKKFVGLALAAIMIIGVSAPAFAAETQTDRELRIAYKNVMSYAASNNIDLDMTYDDFLSNYTGQPVLSYEQSYYSVLVPPAVGNTRSSSSSGGSTYYYNTGFSCPSQATYSKYNLLDVVKKGDVIYEANGGGGITGHIAIVDGIYTKSDGSEYIRLIEAISNDQGGVTRSILDDTRVDEKSVTILRVSGATSDIINEAVKFCRGEVGSSYSLDLAKDTSSNETDWYCSELVWAAYKNQGIDIEVGGLHGEPGITPHDIVGSSKTYTVSYSEQ
ncbi:MAG: YiiX/YebB-like N1pC/P60 family cysteine hydrolase [Clostridiaceae bacterium]|uniref:Uncharacterized protein n=1 Tax=Clostridium porci TaxID=2605778 RepID=A0A7X2NK64_9CLOT|nr:YiiX/YebB-like N1pC/P60 family cysteine hydrolase [Clostridium porci]MCI6126048.1 hypothetical protein [Enterocloster clostridioformis]MDY3230152.1 YiiX/YebB-like N1pC/P60 family cysteine hydrolase [Clostridiaceae bacterium]MSS36170.1 hypothetical protein [Clostridium porci]